jgi:hypothetical protein
VEDSTEEADWVGMEAASGNRKFADGTCRHGRVSGARKTALCLRLVRKTGLPRAGAYEAQERVAEQRLSLVEEYQECVEDAGSNQAKAVACESYPKAAEVLK